jgi:hypothetical protein
MVDYLTTQPLIWRKIIFETNEIDNKNNSTKYIVFLILGFIGIIFSVIGILFFSLLGIASLYLVIPYLVIMTLSLSGIFLFIVAD